MSVHPPAGKKSEHLLDIANMSRRELLEVWHQDQSTLPPKHVSRRLLELSAAWHLQCRNIGRPDQELARLLQRSARPVSEKRCIKPGTRLVREWNGRTHHVEVLADGYRWNEKTYRSLSAIAKAITGSHWSGPRFFGI